MGRREEPFDVRFRRHYVKTDACWIWFKDFYPNGYGHFTFRGVQKGAHRWSYERYVGQIPNGMIVCHNCDNRSCVNPEHLFLGSQQDNITDCVKKGRNPKGEKNGMAKLSEQAVRFILANNSLSSRKLSKMLGVTRHSITNVRNKKTWKHIT